MSDAYNQAYTRWSAQHDRLRDRDVIDAARLISRLAGELGVTVDKLIDDILVRVQREAAEQASLSPQGGRFAEHLYSSRRAVPVMDEWRANQLLSESAPTPDKP